MRILWGPKDSRGSRAHITFLVTPSWGGRTLQFSTPLWAMRTAIIILAVMALAVGAGALGFGRIAHQAISARRLSAENDSLRTQFARLEELDRELQDLSKVDRTLRQMAGLGVYEGAPDTPSAVDPDQERSRQVGHQGQWAPSAPLLVPRIGPISQGFHQTGEDGEMHLGVDIPGPMGATIFAAGNGIVAKSGSDSVYGNMLVIDHGSGVQSLYGHASKLLVGRGDTVWAGQQIAAIGSSGHSSAPHVHFEILQDGRPVDPALFIREWGRREAGGEKRPPR